MEKIGVVPYRNDYREQLCMLWWQLCYTACVVISTNVTGGDYVYLAPGAKINDNAQIADNVICGMNTVIVRDIIEAGTTWAGDPAKKISDKGFYYEEKFKEKRK